jgi:hypothetical protein
MRTLDVGRINLFAFARGPDSGAEEVFPGKDIELRRKVVKGWNAICCWFRYFFVGAREGVPGLVNFVIGNYFFRATQVPSELTALGEILATRRPERALEIGTDYGGTLLFLTRPAGHDC